MSREAVSIVMPAFNAQATIARAVASALAQTWPHFEVIVVSDDGVDYEAVLGRAGIADPRIRHLQSGHIGGGSPPARNVGLDAARYDIVAILDADDAFKPEKLAIMVPLAARHGLASCALDITLPDGTICAMWAAPPMAYWPPAPINLSISRWIRCWCTTAAAPIRATIRHCPA